MITVVEVARDALIDPRGREDSREGHDLVLHPGAGPELRRDRVFRHVEVRREVGGADAPVAGNDLGHPRLQARRIRDARERQFLEEDRARAIGHEKAVHLLGGMRRPESHDPDASPGGGREVPDGGHGAREAGDRDLLSGPGVHFLKVEHPVYVGSDARRRGRPDDGRQDREEARYLARRTLGDEPLPVRHLAFRGEPVEELPVEAVEPDPYDRGLPACGPRRARAVGGLDRLGGRCAGRGRGRARARSRDRTLASATAGQGRKQQNRGGPDGLRASRHRCGSQGFFAAGGRPSRSKSRFSSSPASPETSIPSCTKVGVITTPRRAASAWSARTRSRACPLAISWR